MVTFTEEILNGKLHFLCSDGWLQGILKKSRYMKELMAQADLPEEASTVKKINNRSLLYGTPLEPLLLSF